MLPSRKWNQQLLRNHSLRNRHNAIFFSDTSSFICNTCSSSSWSCFICHNGITDPSEPDTEIIKCDFNNCGRHYHRIGSIQAEILAEKTILRIFINHSSSLLVNPREPFLVKGYLEYPSMKRVLSSYQVCFTNMHILACEN